MFCEVHEVKNTIINLLCLLSACFALTDSFAEALLIADETARAEINKRAAIQEKIKIKDHCLDCLHLQALLLTCLS